MEKKQKVQKIQFYFKIKFFSQSVIESFARKKGLGIFPFLKSPFYALQEFVFHIKPIHPSLSLSLFLPLSLILSLSLSVSIYDFCSRAQIEIVICQNSDDNIYIQFVCLSVGEMVPFLTSSLLSAPVLFKKRQGSRLIASIFINFFYRLRL